MFVASVQQTWLLGSNRGGGGVLTGTGGDVALLVLLRRALARLAPVLGLWVAAGSLAAADAAAAVPAALRPGGPGRPAAVHGVPGDPPEAENVSCERGGGGGHH